MLSLGSLCLALMMAASCDYTAFCDWCVSRAWPACDSAMRGQGVKEVDGLPMTPMLMTGPSHTSLPSHEAHGDLALRFHLVPELHFTLSLMLLSLSSFFWAAMLMMLIMYLVALYFTIVRS